MTGLLHQVGVSLRLYVRNRMALIYGYLFPAIFLGAFGVLYRYESVPLLRHMGELLTVTVLGGACFGLPTTMVSERERGVWRRYRLTPIPTYSIVASTLAARYVILITAGMVQLSLALAAGMTMPRHPFDLWLAFTLVSFAFLGLGLVIATMADTVPAVQALGQCLFLPMLIIGGVAVPLASLPEWAQHVSAFFPGRYAVEILQATVTGGGLADARFSAAALVVIGAAGCVAGGMLFRWDAQQRFAATTGRGWVAVALAGWVVVGMAAESRGRVRTTPSPAPSALAPTTEPEPSPAAASVPVATRPVTPEPQGPRPTDADRATPEVRSPKPDTGTERPAPPRPPIEPPTSWQAVTVADIDRDLTFERLPPDAGIVAPIAPMTEDPPPEVIDELEMVRQLLPQWAPARVSDPVQRVRNLLTVAAVPDVLQLSIERYTASVVFERVQEDIPKDRLVQVLYWIALHPFDGDDTALEQVAALGFDGRADPQQTRERIAFYAVKLLGRLLGKITPR